MQPRDRHTPASGPGVKAARLAWAGICAGSTLALLPACVPAATAPSAVSNTDLPEQTETFAPQEEPLASLPAQFEFGGELTQGGWIRGVVPARTVSATFNGEPLALSPDGSFFAAFDRDAGPHAVLVAMREGGSAVRQDISVSPRAWNIEHVNIARRSGGPSAAFMRIREPELARIAAARAVRSESDGWRQSFIWPAQGRISGRFGSQRIYRGEAGSYHSGIDIATGESGTPFVAPADGVVVLASEQPFSLEGKLLIIDHGMGLNSAFLHCSELAVKEGERVSQGQYIGRIGMTGRATGPHLHWSMKWQDARVDPILLTGPMR